MLGSLKNIKSCWDFDLVFCLRFFVNLFWTIWGLTNDFGFINVWILKKVMLKDTPCDRWRGKSICSVNFPFPPFFCVSNPNVFISLQKNLHKISFEGKSIFCWSWSAFTTRIQVMCLPTEMWFFQMIAKAISYSAYTETNSIDPQLRLFL